MASTVAARVVPGRLSIKKQLRRTAPLKNVWKIVSLFTFFPYGGYMVKKVVACSELKWLIILTT